MTPLKPTDQFRLIKAADVKEGMWIVDGPGQRKQIAEILHQQDKVFLWPKPHGYCFACPFDALILIVEPAE